MISTVCTVDGPGGSGLLSPVGGGISVINARNCARTGPGGNSPKLRSKEVDSPRCSSTVWRITSPRRSVTGRPAELRNRITTRVGPGGKLESFAAIILLTLTRTVCPSVMPINPNEMRSLTGGGIWSWACTFLVLCRTLRVVNIVIAASTVAIVKVRFVFICFVSLLCLSSYRSVQPFFKVVSCSHALF